MIELSAVTKSFASVNAVDNLSFSVAAGEVFGVLGSNGAGKSTCMKMISGFLRPDSGNITLFAKTHADDPIAIKQMIGYLPEGAPSYGEMTVLAFLQFIADVRGIRGKNKKLRVDKVL
jgi:ABC-2 type transport system ATP-binding protein